MTWVNQPITFFILKQLILVYTLCKLFFGHIAFEILVPQPGIEPGPMAVKTWSPNHLSAWEVPMLCKLNDYIFQLAFVF